MLDSTWWLIVIHHVQNRQAASVTDLLELQVWPCASCLRVGHCKALIMFEETGKVVHRLEIATQV